jgi:hypothetical protein
VLGLPTDCTIWEIEIPSSAGTRPIIRVTLPPEGGEESHPWRGPDSMRIGGATYEVEYLPHDRSFVGCLKAYATAEREHWALMSTIARYVPPTAGEARPPERG